MNTANLISLGRVCKARRLISASRTSRRCTLRPAHWSSASSTRLKCALRTRIVPSCLRRRTCTSTLSARRWSRRSLAAHDSSRSRRASQLRSSRSLSVGHSSNLLLNFYYRFIYSNLQLKKNVKITTVKISFDVEMMSCKSIKYYSKKYIIYKNNLKFIYFFE